MGEQKAAAAGQDAVWEFSRLCRVFHYFFLSAGERPGEGYKNTGCTGGSQIFLCIKAILTIAVINKNIKEIYSWRNRLSAFPGCGGSWARLLPRRWPADMQPPSPPRCRRVIFLSAATAGPREKCFPGLFKLNYKPRDEIPSTAESWQRHRRRATYGLQGRRGIQITASHNPLPYNGLKLFSAKGRVIPAGLEGSARAISSRPAGADPARQVGRRFTVRRYDQRSFIGRYGNRRR